MLMVGVFPVSALPFLSVWARLASIGRRANSHKHAQTRSLRRESDITD